MEQFIKYVGLDVHGKTIASSVADSRSGEVRFIGQIANTPEAMVKLVDQVKSKGAEETFASIQLACSWNIRITSCSIS